MSRAGALVDDPIPGAEPSVVAVDDTAAVASAAAIVADDVPTETLLPVAAVAASRDADPSAEPAKSKGSSTRDRVALDRTTLVDPHCGFERGTRMATLDRLLPPGRSVSILPFGNNPGIEAEGQT